MNNKHLETEVFPFTKNLVTAIIQNSRIIYENSENEDDDFWSMLEQSDEISRRWNFLLKRRKAEMAKDFNVKQSTDGQKIKYLEFYIDYSDNLELHTKISVQALRKQWEFGKKT